MATNNKTPLQAVVGVICDCLADLPADDQLRTLEAVRVTLGLRGTTHRRPVPTVHVQMSQGGPVIMDEPQDLAAQPDRALVIALPGGTPQRLRQLPPPVERAAPPRGFVRTLRG